MPSSAKADRAKARYCTCLATLDAPTDGEVRFLGHRIDNLPSAHRDRLRNEELGMIFQFYHLLPELTTLENVLMPLLIHASGWNYLRHAPPPHRRREANCWTESGFHIG